MFSNRDKRTLLDELTVLFLGVVSGIEAPGAILLADAYYASGKIIKPLFKRGYHLMSRCVATRWPIIGRRARPSVVAGGHPLMAGKYA